VDLISFYREAHDGASGEMSAAQAGHRAGTANERMDKRDNE
jgi:hypothetical protein